MADAPPRPAAPGPETRAWIAAAMAMVAAAIEQGGGVLTGSTALQAEALHTGAHGSAFLLAAGAYLAERRLRGGRSIRRRLRLPVVAAGLNGLLMVGLGSDLAVETWRRFHAPQSVEFGPAVAIGVFGLAVSLGLLFVLNPRDHHGDAGETLNLRAVYLHILADTGVAVLAIVGLCLGRWLHWTRADTLAGAAGTALVLFFGLGVIVRAARLMTGAR